jgi:hypothetical protein
LLNLCKLSRDEATVTPAVSLQRGNAWKTKRAPQFTYDSDTDFPALNQSIGANQSSGASKKARHNINTNEASVNTVNMTNSDKRTEFDSRMSTLTTDFQKKLNEIANASEQRSCVTAQKLQQAKSQCAAESAQLLAAFKTTQRHVDDAFDAISDLKATLLQKES